MVHPPPFSQQVKPTNRIWKVLIDSKAPLLSRDLHHSGEGQCRSLRKKISTKNMYGMQRRGDNPKLVQEDTNHLTKHYQDGHSEKGIEYLEVGADLAF